MNTRGKVVAGSLGSIGGLSILSWSLISIFSIDIHFHFGPTSTEAAQAASRPTASSYQPSQAQPAPTPISAPPETKSATPATNEQLPPKQLSYEECWNLARRAHSDLSVAVPPDCREAQQELERRLQEQEARERQQAEEDQRARQQAAQQAEYERQRAEQQAEENRRRNEEAQRSAQEEQRRIEQDRQQRAREIVRTGKDIIDKLRRKN